MIAAACWNDEELAGARTVCALRRNGVRTVNIGSVRIGGESAVSIQSMTTTRTEDVQGTLKQITELARAGCQIVRVAVPSAEAADGLPALTEKSPIPVVADIHFNHKLALIAIEAGVHAVRLNPGNIGSMDKVVKVSRAAAAAGIPIRIGVNGGSLEKEIYERHGGPTADALVESALRHIEILERLSFHDIIISLKSSSVPVTVQANRRMAALRSYPLHVGVTEAGSGEEGRAKSLLGIALLLLEGIGETIRISLTENPVAEVYAARNLIRLLGRLGR